LIGRRDTGAAELAGLAAVGAVGALAALTGCFEEPRMTVVVTRPSDAYSLKVRICELPTLDPPCEGDADVFTAGVGDNQADVGVFIEDGTDTLSFSFIASGAPVTGNACTLFTLTDPGGGVTARASVRVDGLLEITACPSGACLVSPTHPDCP
jgi:hypothetical protein